MDRYKNFSELAAHESAYHIRFVDRNCEVTVIAPHGGRIEPNTSEIAALIAADDCNLFCFNGLKAGSNRDLHITSHRFDHPRALALARKAATVVAVHGCMHTDPIVHLGGLDAELIERTRRRLHACNIVVEPAIRRYAGINPENLCNRGTRRKGMQIEVSRPLRDSPAAHIAIATAVRSALQKQNNGRG
ncbi:MAG: poly-gamma-glutamate hydrolase family protein [Desulfofustis sp.]|jgi:phage replication-related protein YjqB (UPF0714/DUF867 family)|nr:poly-gamma-glutamate hydrolase family protein [Desulfofustis sp.]